MSTNVPTKILIFCETSQTKCWTSPKGSVTRLGDLLHFRQLFKAGGKNYFAQITHIFGNFCKRVKIFHFSSGIIFGQPFIDIWRLFTDHTA